MGFPEIVKMMIILKTASIALILVSLAAAAEESDLVKEVCTNSTSVQYDDCVQALYSNFHEKPVKDLRTLTIMSLNLAMANTSEAMGYASGMAENSPPALKDVLQSCTNAFQGSYNSFRSALWGVEASSPMADITLLTAWDGASNCRTFMKQGNVSIPAVATRCNYVELFALVCDTATLMLIQKERQLMN